MIIHCIMKTDTAAAHGFTTVSHFVIFYWSHVTEYCTVIGPALYRAAVSWWVSVMTEKHPMQRLG